MAARAVERTLITLDTSALFALINRRDPDHGRVKEQFMEERSPYIIPCGIMSEIAYLVERRLPRALDAFLADVDGGAFTIDCGDEDLARVRELVSRYADLDLGYADAAVIACAERHGGRVLTLDQRDFGVVAAEGSISLLPQ
jgi:uncharacterized protein